MSSTPRDLALYIERHGETAFDWRSANCVHFAMQWFQSREQRDVLGTLADAASPADAARRVARQGGLLEAVDAAIGRPRIPPALAQVGDIVSARMGGDARALGVCCGRVAAFRCEPAGILNIPMTEVDTAWPVGRAA